MRRRPSRYYECERCAWIRACDWRELIFLWKPGWEPTERDGERIRSMALAAHEAAGHPAAERMQEALSS